MKSPIGTIRMQYSGKGLYSLVFVDQDVPDVILQKELEECGLQLHEYFNGLRKEFTISLDLQDTDFRKSVWKELLLVKFGQTITYGDLARKMGDIKAIRAVAGANAVNPVSIIVPCHRVIGSDGSLTGYAGGLWRKQWLLEHEQKHHQLSLF
jgi:methylated-DNA-[protein]-cysteine S-methyltransferase